MRKWENEYWNIPYGSLYYCLVSACIRWMLITLRIHHLCRNWSCWKLRRIRIPPRYPVAKTTPEEYQDIVKQSPADLRDPENVKTTIEYDLKTNTYIVRTKLGDMEIGTPMSLTPAEYQDYSMQQSLRSYFRQKNEEEFQKGYE